MVVFDPEAASCSIYEVKHSAEAVEAQYRHLVDEEKCKTTEFRFGPITGKYVIYRGEAEDINGILHNCFIFLPQLGQSNVNSLRFTKGSSKSLIMTVLNVILL